MIKLNIPNLTAVLSGCRVLVTRYGHRDNPWVHVSHITVEAVHYDVYIELPSDVLNAIAEKCEGGVVRGLYLMKLDDECAVLAYRRGDNPTHEAAYYLDILVGNISIGLAEQLTDQVVLDQIERGY